jgi:glycine betaine/proline transport system permease protein
MSVITSDDGGGAVPATWWSDPSLRAWFAVAVLCVLTIALRKDLPWLLDVPKEWQLPVSDVVNSMMAWFVDTFRWLFRALSWLLTWPMSGMRIALQWLPWPATITLIALLAYAAGGVRLTVFTIIALMYMVIVGYWQESMATLSLVFMSVPLAVGLGLAMGIAAFKWQRVDRMMQPALDIMQTFPTFAYLIPILFLFGFGPVVGLIASGIYAAPPMVRNTILGLRRVPSETIESGLMSGATKRQLLWRVRVPSAMPTIMIGVNQSIMAAFSMVIIASVIGSSADIGWEVLSMMRKALFGQSLLAGVVIALLAMIMDRISLGFAQRGGPADASSGGINWRRYGLIAVIVTVVVSVMAEFVPLLREYPREWVVFPADALNNGVNYIIANYFGVLDVIKNNTLYFFLLPIRLGLENTVKPWSWGMELTPTFIAAYVFVIVALTAGAAHMWGSRAAVAVVIVGAFYYYGTTGMPWPAFLAIVTLLAYQVGGWRIALFAALGILFILFTGVWGVAMRSVYLCAAAALFSFVVGGAIGLWAANNDRVSRFIRPINDTLQTMPLFVFLIPVIMFFQVGDFPALLAIILYAIVPAVRYSEHGIRQVPQHIVDAARMQGCTNGQIKWKVQLPLALPEIVLGLNQTIMFALAMLVIAALVGTKGLGQAVYIALNAGNVGDGFVAGLSMAFIAMIADRIIQSWSRKKKRELGFE